MVATCPHCSKQLKVKDEWAGRTLKCPACSNTFKAGAASPARVVAGQPTNPAALRAKAERGRGSVAFNWGQLVTWGLLSLIPIVILYFVFGPIRVYRNWRASEPLIRDNVNEVLSYALQCRASHTGDYNPRKSHSPPRVTDIRFLPDFMRLTNHEVIKFDGVASNGTFEGTYIVATGEVDAEVRVEGLTLPSGLHIGPGGVNLPGTGRVATSAIPGKKQEREDAFHVTGRFKDGVAAAEIDGKKAELYWPPEVDEDGNLIVQPEP